MQAKLLRMRNEVIGILPPAAQPDSSPTCPSGLRWLLQARAGPTGQDYMDNYLSSQLVFVHYEIKVTRLYNISRLGMLALTLGSAKQL